MQVDELQLGSSRGQAFEFNCKAGSADQDPVHVRGGPVTKTSDNVIYTSNLSDAHPLLARFHLANGVDSVFAVGCPFDGDKIELKIRTRLQGAGSYESG